MLLTGILVGAVVLVTLLIVGLKTNAAMVFLALCSGSVLVTLMGEEVSLVAASISSGSLVAPIAAKVALLLLPAFLCIVFMQGAVSSSKMLFQLLPALAAGIVAVLLVVPLLSIEFQKTIADNFIWQQFVQYQPLVVLVGVFGSLLVAAVSARDKHGEHGKKKHH